MSIIADNTADRGALIIRLPFLRELPEYGACDDLPEAVRLWPGLPEMPDSGWHHPVNFPMAPEAAMRFLRDLETYGTGELAYLQTGHLIPENRRASRDRAEMRDLAAFARDGAPGLEDSFAGHALEQAQKILLWVWLAQGRLQEIARLTRDFARNATIFSESLAAGEENPPPPLEGRISLDEGLAPGWEAVLLNALPFLPPNTLILAEGAMRRDLMELPGWSESGREGWLVLTAAAGALPGLGAVGRKRVADRPLRFLIRV